MVRNLIDGCGNYRDADPEPREANVKERIVDPKMVEWVVKRRDGYCLYGISEKQGCSGGVDPHHIDSKGSGGDDIPENLITLCRKHHIMAQENLISKYKLRGILTKYFGYEYRKERV